MGTKKVETVETGKQKKRGRPKVSAVGLALKTFFRKEKKTTGAIYDEDGEIYLDEIKAKLLKAKAGSIDQRIFMTRYPIRRG